MSFLYFPNVFSKSGDDIHIYIFPNIIYEAKGPEFTFSFNCLLSDFQYPDKYKAQILYATEETEQLSKTFISTDYKDISINIWKTLHDQRRSDLGRLGFIPKNNPKKNPFDKFNESFIYIRIKDYSTISEEDIKDELIDTDSSLHARIIYSQLRIGKRQLGVLSLDRLASNQILEFRKLFVPKYNTHLEFVKLEIPIGKYVDNNVDTSSFRKEKGEILGESTDHVIKNNDRRILEARSKRDSLSNITKLYEEIPRNKESNYFHKRYISD